MTIDQVLSAEMQSKFENVATMPFNVGYSSSVFWLKIIIDEGENRKLVLDPG